MMEPCSFPKTSLVNETTLSNQVKDPNLVSITLMGIVNPRKQTGGPRKLKRLQQTAKTARLFQSSAAKGSKLLYAKTYHAPSQIIRNILQLACNILGESKIIFFSTLLFLESVINPALGSKCYGDTDR